MGDSPAIHVWVTRPQADAESFAVPLRQQGMMPWLMPVLRIHAYPAPADAQRLLMQADKIIVTSRHAITQARAQGLSLPTAAAWFAVGRATADALLPDQLRVQLPEQQDSEGLLALDGLTQIAGESILLLKGVGGRSLLAEQLCHRGAQVTELPLYQRQCCLPDARMVDEFLQAAGQHWLVLASGETLACLWQGINKAQAERLVTQCQLVVMSQRVAERAIALGWHSDQIRVAASASMSGLLATIA